MKRPKKYGKTTGENRTARKNFSFPPAFIAECQKAADSEGISLVEWFIKAGNEKLERLKG